MQNLTGGADREEDVTPNMEESNKNNNSVFPYSSPILNSKVEHPITSKRHCDITIYAKAMTTLNKVQSLQLQTTADSGATHDMTGIKEFF